jgi:hypothetical protein
MPLAQPYNEGEFVAALYKKQRYIGEILEYDPDDDEVLVTFMKKTGFKVPQYAWPRPADELWIPVRKLQTT